MTVGELKKILEQYPDDEPVWVYDPNDDGEPYQAIAEVERGPFGEITIYRS